MMRLSTSLLVGVAAAGLCAAVVAAASAPTTFTPAGMHWIAGTGASKGTADVVFVGNPDKSGTAIIRVKMPDGYVNQPHYHATAEYITVMQGTLLFGTGDSIDKAKATVLPTGSFIAVPAGVHHWSIAKGVTVEQVGGMGPLTNLPIKHASM